MPSLILAIDLVAVAVFAVTGALSASRRGMDIIGYLWLGTVTGVGGGTLRDLLLGQPVFWVNEPLYLIVAASVSTVSYFAAHLPRSRYQAILWLDAIGLAFVTVVGASKALALGFGPAIAVVMGVITATLGGIVRDILAHQPSILLTREIYVTAALVGAVVFVAAVGLGFGQAAAAVLGLAAGLGLRGGALVWGWTLPGPAAAESDPD
jgi:uncharacterized membrane protein YeiH